MKKKRIYICMLAGLFLTVCSTLRAQQQIADIETAGNITVSRTKIISLIRSRAGDTFDQATADEDAKRIAQLEAVDYCYYNTTAIDGKIRLTFVIVEHNLIRAIEIDGNKKYKDKKLKKVAGIKVGNYFDPVIAEAARSRILEHYHNKGFPLATATLDREGLEKGQLFFTIKEGPRVRIIGVKFLGNRALKTKSLKKVIKVKKTKLLVLRRYLVEKQLADEVDRLVTAYYKKGFLDVKIKQQQLFSKNKTNVTIVYEIDEGPAYSVNEIAVKGAEHFEIQSLIDGLSLEKGQTYNDRLCETDIKNILKRYRENGFIDTKVEKKINYVSTGKVDIEINITEGKRFRIGHINITGNQETQDKVIRRVLDEYNFTPGQWYNADIARGDGKGKLEKEVKRSVMLDSAIITPRGETPDQKDAEVSVTEGQTGSVMLGAGVASDSGLIGQIVFQQSNFDIKDKPESLGEFFTGKAFKGAGQNLRISLEPGTELSRYSISFTEPYLYNKPLAMNVTGSSWDRIRESYDEERLKGYLGFERRLKNDWTRSVGFRIEEVKLTGLEPDAPKEIRDNEDDNMLAGIKMGISRDLTDDKIYPTTGKTYSASYEQVGGDHTFGILSGTYRKYRTIYIDLAERKTILATKLHAATVIGDAPPFEKFYAGGSGSLRGFEYRGISPRGVPTAPGGAPIAGRKSEDPIGSDWIFLANAEIIMPLASDNFAILFFVDSGTVDTGDYRASIGTGVQILIPRWFGPVPMRLELATPFMKDGDDDTQVFSFSVGRLF